VSTNIKLVQRDRIIGQLVYGEGIASHMNDRGMDLAPRLARPEPDLKITAGMVPLTGVVAYSDRWRNDRWSSSIGYSFT
jgi:hypothetical protein